MAKVKLDKYERETERALEKAAAKGTLKSASKKTKASLVRAAQASVNQSNKEARINIRLTNDVLDRVRTEAAKEGIPYQTFIASALFKLVTGQYVPRQQWEEVLERIAKKVS